MGIKGKGQKHRHNAFEVHTTCLKGEGDEAAQGGLWGPQNQFLEPGRGWTSFWEQDQLKVAPRGNRVTWERMRSFMGRSRVERSCWKHVIPIRGLRGCGAGKRGLLTLADVLARWGDCSPSIRRGRGNRLLPPAAVPAPPPQEGLPSSPGTQRSAGTSGAAQLLRPGLR